MRLDCAEQERDRAIAKGFLGSSNSSSVQQVQLPYARSHSFFDHKSSSSSSSTATWRRGRSTRRSLLLRVCVHTQFHFTKKNNFFCCTPHFYPNCTGWKRRRYSEITAIASFLVLLLCVCLSNAFFSCLFAEKCRSHIFGKRSKDWTHSTQDAVPYRGFYVIKLHDLKGNFSAVPAGQREKLWR
jgi:hypothetical protein